MKVLDNDEKSKMVRPISPSSTTSDNHGDTKATTASPPDGGRGTMPDETSSNVSVEESQRGNTNVPTTDKMLEEMHIRRRALMDAARLQEEQDMLLELKIIERIQQNHRLLETQRGGGGAAARLDPASSSAAAAAAAGGLGGVGPGAGAAAAAVPGSANVRELLAIQLEQNARLKQASAAIAASRATGMLSSTLPVFPPVTAAEIALYRQSQALGIPYQNPLSNLLQQQSNHPQSFSGLSLPQYTAGATAAAVTTAALGSGGGSNVDHATKLALQLQLEAKRNENSQKESTIQILQRIKQNRDRLRRLQNIEEKRKEQEKPDQGTVNKQKSANGKKEEGSGPPMASLLHKRTRQFPVSSKEGSGKNDVNDPGRHPSKKQKRRSPSSPSHRLDSSQQQHHHSLPNATSTAATSNNDGRRPAGHPSRHRAGRENKSDKARQRLDQYEDRTKKGAPSEQHESRPSHDRSHTIHLYRSEPPDYHQQHHYGYPAPPPPPPHHDPRQSSPHHHDRWYPEYPPHHYQDPRHPPPPYHHSGGRQLAYPPPPHHYHHPDRQQHPAYSPDYRHHPDSHPRYHDHRQHSPYPTREYDRQQHHPHHPDPRPYDDRQQHRARPRHPRDRQPDPPRHQDSRPEQHDTQKQHPVHRSHQFHDPPRQEEKTPDVAMRRKILPMAPKETTKDEPISDRTMKRFLRNSKLVLLEDRKDVPDSVIVAMSQMIPCKFMEEDRIGCYQDRDVGSIGLCCKHCGGKPGFGRYFPSSVSSLEQTLKVTISHHISSKCHACPPKVRHALFQVQRQEFEPIGGRSYGSRKAFFENVWTRLHDEKGFLEKSNHDETKEEEQDREESIERNDDDSSTCSSVVPSNQQFSDAEEESYDNIHARARKNPKPYPEKEVNPCYAAGQDHAASSSGREEETYPRSAPPPNDFAPPGYPRTVNRVSSTISASSSYSSGAGPTNFIVATRSWPEGQGPEKKYRQQVSYRERLMTNHPQPRRDRLNAKYEKYGLQRGADTQQASALQEKVKVQRRRKSPQNVKSPAQTKTIMERRDFDPKHPVDSQRHMAGSRGVDALGLRGKYTKEELEVITRSRDTSGAVPEPQEEMGMAASSKKRRRIALPRRHGSGVEALRKKDGLLEARVIWSDLTNPEGTLNMFRRRQSLKLLDLLVALRVDGEHFCPDKVYGGTERKWSGKEPHKIGEAAIDNRIATETQSPSENALRNDDEHIHRGGEGKIFPNLCRSSPCTNGNRGEETETPTSSRSSFNGDDKKNNVGTEEKTVVSHIKRSPSIDVHKAIKDDEDENGPSPGSSSPPRDNGSDRTRREETGRPALCEASLSKNENNASDIVEENGDATLSRPSCSRYDHNDIDSGEEGKIIEKEDKDGGEEGEIIENNDISYEVDEEEDDDDDETKNLFETLAHVQPDVQNTR